MTLKTFLFVVHNIKVHKCVTPSDPRLAKLFFLAALVAVYAVIIAAGLYDWALSY